MTRYQASRLAADLTAETGRVFIAIPDWGHQWRVIDVLEDPC